MLTQCPHCQTTFRVTSEILRVADGQVRCGRCQTQFDALDRLIDDSDAHDMQSLRPTQTEPPASDIEVEEPDTREDITMEGRRIESTGAYKALDDEPQRAHFREEVMEERVEIDDAEQLASADGAFQVVEVRGDEAEEFDDADVLEGEPGPEDPEALTAHDESSPELDLDLQPVRRAHTEPRWWKWLIAPLALLLFVQIVQHHRSTLARDPRLGSLLMGIYDALGLTLTPAWNLHAYEIRQWGVVSDPATPGALKVRASITNLAEFPQPYPLLKLMLEDRWGDQVGARAFEPAEYLDPGAAPDRLLAPAQKANATINIVDPGPDAEGFRFDVCLAGKRGVVCAEETPRS